MRILLVDDDVFLRDMYATKFMEKGDDVVGVGDARRALELLSEEPFDAVIMDMVMPGMTGIDLLRAIKEITQAQHVRCIVLSNQGEEADIQKAMEHGAAGYIIKAELIPSEVVERVHNLVT